MGGINSFINSKLWILEYTISYSNSMDLSFFIVLDWLSCIFLSTVTIISLCVFIYSQEYIHDHYGRFIRIVSLFVLSILLIVISPNILSILLGWDILGLVSFCLVVYYQTNNSYRAGMITVLINRIGDVIILASLSLTLGYWNDLLLDQNTILKVLILIAAITKSAQIPFSSWLPAAISAPTPVSALVHSSTLVTAGVYLLIRYNVLLNGIELYLIIISLLTILIAGFNARIEMDIKKIVALSTLSQLGFIIFGLSLGLHNLVYFHLLIHAFFKSIIFLSVGTIIHGINQDYRILGYVYSPMVSIGLIFSSACLIGLPFLSSFYSKDRIIEIYAISSKNIRILPIILIAIIMTVIYSLRIIKGVLLINYWGSPVISYMENTLINWAIFILSILSVRSGAFIQWILPFNIIILKFKMIGLILLLSMIFILKCSWNLDEISSNTLGLINNSEIVWEEILPTNFDWVPNWWEKVNILYLLITMIWFTFVLY